ncbi:hypothetical protein TNCV_677871 [Trichonephila clavipes]|nr:hypothetical protein TNCV_677871 [Trichonephila clavipes]
MENLDHLSQSEFEKIASVLKRDRELRVMEEARIRRIILNAIQYLKCLQSLTSERTGMLGQIGFAGSYSYIISLESESGFVCSTSTRLESAMSFGAAQ